MGEINVAMILQQDIPVIQVQQVAPMQGQQGPPVPMPRRRNEQWLVPGRPAPRSRRDWIPAQAAHPVAAPAAQQPAQLPQPPQPGRLRSGREYHGQLASPERHRRESDEESCKSIKLSDVENEGRISSAQPSPDNSPIASPRSSESLSWDNLETPTEYQQVRMRPPPGLLEFDQGFWGEDEETIMESPKRLNRRQRKRKKSAAKFRRGRE